MGSAGGDDAPLPGGTFSTLLFEGIDLQQDALSPDYMPATFAAPVVPTLGPGVHAQALQATNSMQQIWWRQ
jgi:hypothetical protein